MNDQILKCFNERKYCDIIMDPTDMDNIFECIEKMISVCNHLRIYISDNLEENSYLNYYPLLLLLNKRLYDPSFYVDIICSPKENTLSTFCNTYVLLKHHPAFQQHRINIKDANGGSFDTEQVKRKFFIIGDYEMYIELMETQETSTMKANFHDIEYCLTLGINYDDTKNILKNVV